MQLIVFALPLQKCPPTLKLLTSGVSPQDLDDKYQMTKSTGLKNIQRFCQGIDSLYGKQVL
jgi:hypothetical protein